MKKSVFFGGLIISLMSCGSPAENKRMAKDGCELYTKYEAYQNSDKGLDSYAELTTLVGMFNDGLEVDGINEDEVYELIKKDCGEEAMLTVEKLEKGLLKIE